jgi:hypothetical protein
MIYTKKLLIDILEKYSDEDVLVGTLWSKFDVDYELAEIASSAEYEGVDPTEIEKLNVSDFWNSYFEKLDKDYDQDTSHQSGELYFALVNHLKGENK